MNTEVGPSFCYHNVTILILAHTSLYIYVSVFLEKVELLPYRYKHLNLHRELNGWGFIRSDWNSSSALGSIFMKPPLDIYTWVFYRYYKVQYYSYFLPIPFFPRFPFHNLVPSFLFLSLQTKSHSLPLCPFLSFMTTPVSADSAFKSVFESIYLFNLHHNHLGPRHHSLPGLW